jgi:SAM-dependent methyltransferase
MAPSKPVKGWFSTPGRPGDRTLADQLKGLDPLLEACKGKTVLDVGCAEGLISLELVKRGASAVHGVEIVKEHVEVARRASAGLPVMFEHADLNHWRPRREYHIVIALAVLHKLRNPTEVAKALAGAARELVVLRLPPRDAPVIIDSRSGHEPHHIGDAMGDMGFELAEESYAGHYNEWVGVYTRRTK